MPSCAIPNCLSNSSKYPEKVSLFQVPNDESVREKWIAAIPNVSHLRRNQRVCELHFAKHEIIKDYLSYDTLGNVSQVKETLE